jgi:hypothetical protein
MTFIVFFQLIVAMHLILSSFPDLCLACFPGDSLGCSGGSALQNLVRTETFTPSTQYFVDPQLGNDLNSGLSPSAAFQSIQRAQLAVRNATSSLRNGGVTGGGVAVNLLPGLYTLLKSPVVFSSAAVRTPERELNPSSIAASTVRPPTPTSAIIFRLNPHQRGRSW